MTNLLKGIQRGRKLGLFDWLDSTQEAFKKLKQYFLKALLLRHYDLTLPVRVETDTSRDGMGGVLSQRFEDRWHSITFFSKKLNDAQTRYLIGDQEMLIVHYTFKEWRHYLESLASSVQVIVDH